MKIQLIRGLVSGIVLTALVVIAWGVDPIGFGTGF